MYFSFTIHFLNHFLLYIHSKFNLISNNNKLQIVFSFVYIIIICSIFFTNFVILLLYLFHLIYIYKFLNLFKTKKTNECVQSWDVIVAFAFGKKSKKKTEIIFWDISQRIYVVQHFSFIVIVFLSHFVTLAKVSRRVPFWYKASNVIFPHYFKCLVYSCF